MSTLTKTNLLLQEKLEKLQAAQKANRESHQETKAQQEEIQTGEGEKAKEHVLRQVTNGRGISSPAIKSGAKRRKKSGQHKVDSKPKGVKQNKTIYSINSMEMVRTGEIDKNQPPLTPQQLQGAWGFLSVPMGLALSPAHWFAQ